MYFTFYPYFFFSHSKKGGRIENSKTSIRIASMWRYFIFFPLVFFFLSSNSSSCATFLAMIMRGKKKGGRGRLFR